MSRSPRVVGIGKGGYSPSLIHFYIMSDKNARMLTTGLRFARSATRHRVSKDSMRYVLSNHSVQFEEAPPAGQAGARSIRLVHLGDDATGQALEVMAIKLADGDLLVIHAMALRDKYKRRYEEVKR
jgi:hypothetical protein